MTTQKTWTAVDVKQKRLTLSRTLKDASPAIRVERRYVFVDAEDEPLTNIAVGRFVTEVLIASVPAHILAAVQEIDDWTYQEILKQEGME